MIKIRRIIFAFMPGVILMLLFVASLQGVFYTFSYEMFHFLAGSSVMWCVLKLIQESKSKAYSYALKFIIGLGITALVAIGWEVFEAILGVLTPMVWQASIWDTVMDQVLALLGASVLYFILRLSKKL